jgi:lipoate-protein ligase A
MAVKLFDLGFMPWKDTQLVYHALAKLGIEALVVQRTRECYVSLGLFNTPQELDLEYMRSHGIPYFRREIGGGIVLLDSEQLFYHVIVHRDSAHTPVKTDSFYRKFLAPVIATYKELGLEARYKPANDLVVGERKISGNGAGLIGECKVLSGSILFDFNRELMARVLRLPNEVFRARAKELMEERLTTLREQLGSFSASEVKRILIENFESLFGSLEKAELTPEIEREMRRLEKKYLSPEWLNMPGRGVNGRELKIAEGCYLVFAPVGEVEIIAERREGELAWVRATINGARMSKLEESLTGESASYEKILNILRESLEYSPSVEEAARVIAGGN